MRARSRRESPTRESSRDQRRESQERSRATSTAKAEPKPRASETVVRQRGIAYTPHQKRHQSAGPPYGACSTPYWRGGGRKTSAVQDSSARFALSSQCSRSVSPHMDSKSRALATRVINIMVAVAIVVILVAGIFPGTAATVFSAIGLLAAVVGLIYGLVTAGMRGQRGWITLLAIAVIAGVVLALVGYTRANSAGVTPLVGAAQLGGLFIAFAAFAYGTLNGHGALERGVPAFLGGWGLLTLVIGGTLVGGAIGTSVGAASQNVTTLGFHLYSVAGALGLFAWVTGMIIAFRTQAWGWFILTVLLPGIGAFMFGLFGPTFQDVIMARENAQRRRAVGMR